MKISYRGNTNAVSKKIRIEEKYELLLSGLFTPT